MMTGRGFVRLNRFLHAGGWQKKGPELTTKLSGKRVGILGLGRIGKAIASRVARARHGGRVHRPQQAGRAVPLRTRISRRSRPIRTSSWSRVPAVRRRRTSSTRKCSPHSARRARSSTSRAGRSSTRMRSSRRCRRARSRAPASTCSPTSRNVPEALMSMDNVVLLAARRQRDQRDAQGDGRPVQGEPRRVVRHRQGSDADSRARLAPTSRARPRSLLRRGFFSCGWNSTANSDAITSAERHELRSARALAEQDHAREHADHRHGQRRQRRDGDGQAFARA